MANLMILVGLPCPTLRSRINFKGHFSRVFFFDSMKGLLLRNISISDTAWLAKGMGQLWTQLWSGAAKPRSAAARLTPRVHHHLRQPEWLEVAAEENPDTNFKSMLGFVRLRHIFYKQWR